LEKRKVQEKVEKEGYRNFGGDLTAKKLKCV